LPTPPPASASLCQLFRAVYFGLVLLESLPLPNPNIPSALLLSSFFSFKRSILEAKKETQLVGASNNNNTSVYCRSRASFVFLIDFCLFFLVF
jgi:hypothetical protein